MAKPRGPGVPDFDTLIAEARSFRRRKNPPGDAHAFAEALLDQGYSLDGIDEEELRGVATFLTKDEDVARDAWVEDFSAWIGQPAE